ncbi:trypsin-like peptidase domain-containing protein [Streptomyces sp. NPDC048718]|uniref:trypsin-like peptidase domain-containing protein n=1 Tax=Streptomyces sp. NPDC048718 TaxID=3365587 RepID=UPI003719AF34
MGSRTRTALVRIEDPAGRPLGTGFLADHHGTLLTGHEVVAGQDTLCLRTFGGQTWRAGLTDITLFPGCGLALVRTVGLTCPPLPLARRTEIEPGTYVRIAAYGWREARVLGAVDGAGPGLPLAIGTEGAEALLESGPTTGGPVLDPATGAVLAILGAVRRGGRPAEPCALPIPPLGPLAVLLRRNAATVPAYGRDLNTAGVLELAATTTGRSGETGTWGERVRDPGDRLVLLVVGAPGTGRSTALAGLAARRAHGPAPAPTVRLRGADLLAGDASVADAVGRVLRRAGRIVAAGGALGDPAAVTPERAAARGPLLILLDSPEEMPPLLAPRLGPWVAATEEWLTAHGARMIVACRPEHAELTLPLYACAPGVIALGDLTEHEAAEARRRHGVPDGAIADADARHPLALRLLGELRTAARGELPGRPGREEIFAAHLDLMCLRVAVRIAATRRPVPRGAAVRRLAARVAGSVHEAARRCLGPGQGELDRASFEELFPWRTGWASAVLTEALLVPAGGGYRFAHEEVADWLQGAHLDLDRALETLVHHPAALPVPRHRIGPVLQALRRLHRDHGADGLGPRLRRLADTLADCADLADATGSAAEAGPWTPGAGGAEGVWWASRLLAGVLAPLTDARPRLPVLRRLADHIGRRPEARETFAGYAVFGPEFWAGLAVPEGERLDLLRRLVVADPPPGPVGPGSPARFLDVVATRLNADPRGVQPLLCRWFADDRELAGAPGATVGDAAQALLHTHRGLAVDDLCEALVATVHPLAEGLLAALAEDEPTALARAVERWAHDDGRPARRQAAVTYGRMVAPYATGEAERATLRYAALALLARPGDRALHGPALGLLVQDPGCRDRYLPRALAHPGVPADALAAALATHPEPGPVLDALRVRLEGPDPGAVLRALAAVDTPRIARQAAALVAGYAERHPEGAELVAAFVDRRLEAGPEARCVLHPLVVGLLALPAPRAALAPVLDAPGTGASRFLRLELRAVRDAGDGGGPDTGPVPGPGTGTGARTGTGRHSRPVGGSDPAAGSGPDSGADTGVGAGRETRADTGRRQEGPDDPPPRAVPPSPRRAPRRTEHHADADAAACSWQS